MNSAPATQPDDYHNYPPLDSPVPPPRLHQSSATVPVHHRAATALPLSRPPWMLLLVLVKTRAAPAGPNFPGSSRPRAPRVAVSDLVSAAHSPASPPPLCSRSSRRYLLPVVLCVACCLNEPPLHHSFRSCCLVCCIRICFPHICGSSRVLGSAAAGSQIESVVQERSKSGGCFIGSPLK